MRSSRTLPTIDGVRISGGSLFAQEHLQLGTNEGRFSFNVCGRRLLPYSCCGRRLTLCSPQTLAAMWGDPLDVPLGVPLIVIRTLRLHRWKSAQECRGHAQLTWHRVTPNEASQS